MGQARVVGIVRVCVRGRYLARRWGGELEMGEDGQRRW
jgi:hypothetical protein